MLPVAVCVTPLTVKVPVDAELKVHSPSASASESSAVLPDGAVAKASHGFSGYILRPSDINFSVA